LCVWVGGGWLRWWHVSLVCIPPSLVEKWASIPVPEALLYRKSYRYKRFGTKAPPFGTGSLRTGIKGASTLAPRRPHG
jgi:hypothetical protein